MVKKPSFRFWSKCENCLLLSLPQERSAVLSCHCSTPATEPPLVILPVLCLSEPLRIKENNIKDITGWFRKLWVLKACAFGKTVLALWEVTVLRHELRNMLLLLRILLFGADCISLFSSTQRKVPMPGPPFLCTSYRRALFILTRTLLSDPASSIPTAFTTLAAFLYWKALSRSGVFILSLTLNHISQSLEGLLISLSAKFCLLK